MSFRLGPVIDYLALQWAVMTPRSNAAGLLVGNHARVRVPLAIDQTGRLVHGVSHGSVAARQRMIYHSAPPRHRSWPGEAEMPLVADTHQPEPLLGRCAVAAPAALLVQLSSTRSHRQNDGIEPWSGFSRSLGRGIRPSTAAYCNQS